MDEVKIVYNPGTVTCDFDTFKAQLDAQVAPYRNMVFTEDSKKDAKKTVAELRKEQKAFTDRIKEVKRAYMAPFEEFNTKALELVDMFDEPICFINEQIDAFEEKRIEIKKALISDIYEELVPEEDMQKLLPFTKIYNKKWENATTSEKNIKAEIMERKIKVKDDLAIINGSGSDVTDKAIEKYLIAYNLADAMEYIQTAEKQKAEIMAREAERLQREAEERIRAEERAKIEAEKQKAAEIEQAKAETLAELIPEVDETEEKETLTYFITLTASEREALEMYMNSVGIEFKQLPM